METKDKLCVLLSVCSVMILDIVIPNFMLFEGMVRNGREVDRNNPKVGVSAAYIKKKKKKLTFFS